MPIRFIIKTNICLVYKKVLPLQGLSAKELFNNNNRILPNKKYTGHLYKPKKYMSKYLVIK